MKKSKFSKLLNSGQGKQIIFKKDGTSHIGVVIDSGYASDSILVQTNDHRDVTVSRKNIIGTIKKYSWYPMKKMPPENKALLLEHKDGSIKMGRLLGSDGMEFYDLKGHHFHDNYWHKPFPISDFTHWSLVQERS
jgi:hypothetical protein